MCLLSRLGGAFTHGPEEPCHRLSRPAADLLKRAFDDVDATALADYPASGRRLPPGVFLSNPALPL